MTVSDPDLRVRIFGRGLSASCNSIRARYGRKESTR